MELKTMSQPASTANAAGRKTLPAGLLLWPAMLIAVLLVSSAPAWAAGTISGIVTDQSGGVVPETVVSASNLDTAAQQSTSTNAEGSYTLTNLAPGRYALEVLRAGFKPYKRTGLVIESDTQLRVDVSLTVGEQQSEIVVTASEVQVETQDTQGGETITSKEMTAVALNGRSYTDLLALQPGVVPVTTQQPDSIVMAGVTVAIAPSGVLNAGNQSISGQREDANGFLVNGSDVKEEMNGGTAVVPNLDSIAEFRILTNNFDAQYGNYSGGIVSVITKSGANPLHGSAFEFFRNTALDAKYYFSPEKSKFDQNQFGGTLGGPIKKNKAFFFVDYQGTRMTQGIDTGLIPVPSVADRNGNLSDQAGAFTKAVTFNGQQVTVPTTPSNDYVANQVLAAKLGYPVSTSMPYYFTAGEHTVADPSAIYNHNCTSSAECVFPNAVIPTSVISAPAAALLTLGAIPAPNVGLNQFSTGSQNQQLRDDKGSIRMDYDTARWGRLSAYYFSDDYTFNNPYPTGQGGSNVPGYNALNRGRAQLITLSDTKTFGATAVNEFHFSYTRNANVVGQPVGGVGPTLASQGFAAPPTGIFPLAPSIEGIENVVFNSFVIGTPITNLQQANNTFSWIDNFSKSIGTHSLRGGVQFSYEQVNVNPNPTFNGSFTFFGTETGSDFADFLIGVSNNFNQADSQHYYGRHKYPAAFVQDSWRVKPNLTFNYGLRWEFMEYWSEKYNQIPTFVLGQQSKVYPTAPVGLVYPTDPGVPNTLVPARNRFSPRLGIAYSPNKSTGILGKILGGPGKTSLRAGYGVFFSVIQGNTIGIDEPQPPYGLSFTNPGALFATPFISAADGSVHPNPFPLTFPPLNATIHNPNPSIDFSSFLPLAGMTAPPPSNTYPYSENYFLSFQRQLTTNTVLDLSYVGNQAHHLLAIYSANPGNPALCKLLQTIATPKCGPNGEDTTYTITTAAPGFAVGDMINGTRGPLGSSFSNDDYDASIANSHYNSFQVNLRHNGRGRSLLVAYTYSKSVDQSSSLADILNPFNFQATRAPSAFDLRHNFSATYTYTLPLERLFRRSNQFTQGWTVSGITRASSGFPVTISSDSDNSLTGSLPNGVNNKSLDLPDFTSGPLNLNRHPQNGQPYFNTSLFQPNAEGTPGTSSRRFFYGPGSFNTDLAVAKSFQLTETQALQFRLETFNLFNTTQFFGPAAVNGNFDSDLFGQVVKAAPPRLMQIAVKYTF